MNALAGAGLAAVVVVGGVAIMFVAALFASGQWTLPWHRGKQG